MIRPIKFRAWNKENGMRQIFPDDLTVTDRDEFFVMHVGDEPILMQFTGLLDKNKEEIYEGDVVVTERISGGNIKGIIVWKRARFLVEGIQPAPQKEWQIYENMLRYEVIGNIYENPELLK